ncbi:hypothetical protein QBC36DRAFT_100935 [Triangularia setosa]|uniref:Ankyrin repeat protein n=1 Tax=Triangularia setosa TaxID=2587417 RepID=A0AAN7A2X1_9PEZI|nr:hypothetical protein QBC36DRAFT_100935 [Podospora setosa]
MAESNPRTGPTAPPYKLLGFTQNREYPRLPPGYTWDRQKKSYCPRSLRIKSFSGKLKVENKHGYVFCHRGLYERSSGIVDNSFAAIANGISEGFFLHEVDGIVWERLDRAFVAHDMHPKRIAKMEETWDAYSIHEIVNTSHVARGVKLGTAAQKKTPDPGPGYVDEEGSVTDFASAYLNTDGRIPGLLEMLWNETRKPVGRTLQIDFRNEDFAKVFPFYSFHISKMHYPASEGARGAQHTLVWKMFESTMLKGYNWKFESFDGLHREIKMESEKVYERNCFELPHLHMFPPLIMVFQPEPIIALAKANAPSNPRWGKMSYEHLYDVCMKQIGSFVDIGTGGPEMSYNFILEVCHSGLGLRYDKTKKIARNPLNDDLLTDSKVIFEALVDRVMIDVSLELRRRYPDVLFASCTRLPDVTTSERQYKTSFKTAELGRMKDGEAGLSSKLRALHGGLYPRSDIVVADDPMSEIAARTWIDEKGGLIRSRLLHMPYYQWLRTHAKIDVQVAVKSLSEREFLPNKYFPDDALESPGEKVRLWKKGLKTSKVDHNGNPDDDLAAIALADGTFALTTFSDAKQAADSSTAYKAAARGDEKRLRKLIAKRVDLNDATGQYGTPLAVASAKGHSSIVRLLLDAGADINPGQFWGSPLEIASFYGSPLELASYYGHSDVVKLLLAKLATKKDLSGSIPKKLSVGAALHQAAGKGHVAVVQQLLNATADVDPMGDEYRATPLQVASSCGKIDIVRMLLSKNANVNAHGMRHCTALRAACRYGHADIVQLLLRHGAVIDFPLENWFKPEILVLLRKAGPGAKASTRTGPCTSPATEPDPGPEQYIYGELRFDNLNHMAKLGFDVRPLTDLLKSNGWPQQNPRCHLTDLSHSPDHYKILATQRAALASWEERIKRQRESELLEQLKKLTNSTRTDALSMLVKFFSQKQQRLRTQLESCGCLLCIFDKHANQSLAGLTQQYLNVKPVAPTAVTMKQIRDQCLIEYEAKIKSEID